MLCALLAPREVLLLIDGEPVVLVFEPTGIALLTAARRPALELRTGRGTMLDVIDARLTLNEAVRTDALVLQGDVDDLKLAHEGLLTYVCGAVRCPSFPRLLERFRLETRGLLHRDDQTDSR